MRRLAALFVALLALACSSSDSGSSGKTTSHGFQPGATPSGASVTLQARSAGSGKLVLELVGHGLSDVYGLAFRLKYDPAALRFAELEAGPALPGSIALGSEKTSGLLVGALSQKGKQPGVSSDGTVLGVVTFTVQSSKPTTLDFVAGREAVVAATTGEPLGGVSFVGGQLK